MTVWIREQILGKRWGTPFNSIIEARKTAIKLLESGKLGNQGSVPIYKTQWGKALASNVWIDKHGGYAETVYSKEYGVVYHALYKNGKIKR